MQEEEANQLLAQYGELTQTAQHLESFLRSHKDHPQIGSLLFHVIKEHNLSEPLALELLGHLEASAFQHSSLMKLYQQILDDCYYFGVADKLCCYLSQYAAKIGRKSGELMFERLLSHFCYDFEKGYLIYSYYFAFEQEFLKKAENERERKLVEQQLRALYHRHLKVPSKVYYFEQYKSFEQNQAELVKIQKQHAVTLEVVDALKDIEKKFRNKDPTALEWIKDLLDQKKIDIQKICNYFDIALFEVDLEDVSFLLDIIRRNTNPHIVAKILRRLSKKRDIRVEESISYIRVLQQINSDDEILNQEFERLYKQYSAIAEQFKLHQEYVQTFVRQYVANLDGEQPQTPDTIRSKFEKLTSANYEPQMIAQAYCCLGKVEAYLFNNKINARNAFEKCVQLHSDDNSFWAAFFYSQVSTPMESIAQRDRLRGILKRAAEVIKEDRTQAIQNWLEFEQLFGTVEELEKAQARWIKALMADIGEAEAEEEQEESSDEKQHQADIKAKEKSDAPKVFVDSEKTLFVRNLPKEFSADDIIGLLEKDSGATECRVVKDKNQISKGFAYIDFERPQQASKAAGYLNQKVVKGQCLYAAVSKPPKLYQNDALTLYIESLPYSITDQLLTSVCDPGVKEVRIVKDEKGQPRGYAYVEYNNSEQMRQAYERLQANPYIDGRKVYIEFSDSLSKIKQKQQNQVLLLKNIPFTTKQSDIQQIFDGMAITQILIAKHPDGKPRGFAFVSFERFKDFKTALEMDQFEFKGRKIQIIKSDRPITEMKQKDNIEAKKDIQFDKPKTNSEFKNMFNQK